MLDTSRAHILLARGLLLFIALMLFMSLCILADGTAGADDPFARLDYDNATKTVKGIKEGLTAPEDLVIPEGVEYIAGDAFQGEQAIKSITFPSTLKEIGYYAFMHCNGIIEVTIPSEVTVGEMAFKSCESLETVKVLYGNVKIESQAFSDCHNLSKVELAPDTTLSSGGFAFTGSNTPPTICTEANDTSQTIDEGMIASLEYVKQLESKGYAEQASLPAESEAAYEYTVPIDKTSVTVVKYHGRKTDPVIPAQINGKDVTGIASGAFDGHTDIQSITVLSTKLNNDIPEGAFPDRVVLKGYKGPIKDYADTYGVDFENQNMTEKHKITVDPDYTSWLSFSVGTDKDAAEAVDAKRYTEWDVIPNDSKYITVWIERMDNGNDKLIDKIYVKNTDDPLKPGDDEVNDTKSVYVLMAEMQEKQPPGADCVTEEFRRYTFLMPGANITISAELAPLYGSADGKAAPTGISPKDGSGTLTIPSP